MAMKARSSAVVALLGRSSLRLISRASGRQVMSGSQRRVDRLNEACGPHIRMCRVGGEHLVHRVAEADPTVRIAKAKRTACSAVTNGPWLLRVLRRRALSLFSQASYFEIASHPVLKSTAEFEAFGLSAERSGIKAGRAFVGMFPIG